MSIPSRIFGIVKDNLCALGMIAMGAFIAYFAGLTVRLFFFTIGFVMIGLAVDMHMKKEREQWQREEWKMETMRLLYEAKVKEREKA